jgi:prefoldin subunit 5
MTFEEMQQTIDRLLTVQQELQNSQIRFNQSLEELRANIAANREDINELRIAISDLNNISLRHERRIEQLIGYSITGESNWLDVLERIGQLEGKVRKLEGREQ